MNLFRLGYSVQRLPLFYTAITLNCLVFVVFVPPDSSSWSAHHVKVLRPSFILRVWVGKKGVSRIIKNIKRTNGVQRMEQGLDCQYANRNWSKELRH